MAQEKSTRVGALDELVKTSIRLPLRIVRQVDDLGAKLGISNQAIYTLGTFRFLLEMAPHVQGTKKKQQMVAEVQQYFQTLFDSAESG